MHSRRRAVVPLAVAVGIAVGGPAVADAKAPAKAHASGGDAVVLTYPSLVQTRVDRAERALRHAVKRMENNKLDKAAASFKVVRRQTAAAWRGARYVIRTTPAPPAEEDSVHARAHASGDPVVGPTLAAPADTGVLVLGLQHEVAADTIQLIDGAHGTGLSMLSRTLFFALDRRDKAIQDILVLSPPAPPVDDARGRVPVRLRARMSDDPVANTFDILMPSVVPQFADEIQGVDGLKSDATDLTAGGRRLLNAAENQILKTMGVVNTNWPPVPVED
jgi:hypothetical protein